MLKTRLLSSFVIPTVLVFGAGCSATADMSTPLAPRTVLLQYAGRPTTADSLAVSSIGGAPAMVYPIIHSISVRTSVPTSAFSSLNRTPEVDDVDSIYRACGGFGIMAVTSTTASTADSLALLAIGAHRVDMIDGVPDDLYAAFTGTRLDPVLGVVNQLTSDSHFVTADLDLGCAMQ
jgi:hypothetical protein